MRWQVAFLALVVSIVWMADTGVRSAAACSYPAEYNPVNESEMIIGGRVAGWDLYEGDEFEGFNAIPVVFHIEVDQVIKGSAAPTVDFVDTWSLDKLSGPNMWNSSVNTCAGFVQDPSGSYLVIGLQPVEGGDTLRWDNYFYLGPEADGDGYDRAWARIEELGGPSPEEATPPMARDEDSGSPSLLLLVSTAVAGAALLGAAVSFRRRRRVSELLS